jgi:hypothetical protein
MAYCVDPATALFRVPGLYQYLLEQQRRRVVELVPEVDPRILFDATPQEKEQAWAYARAHPRPSELLDKLEIGERVLVGRGDMPASFFALRPPDAPAWCRDGDVHWIRVYIDDLIGPVEGDRRGPLGTIRAWPG